MYFYRLIILITMKYCKISLRKPMQPAIIYIPRFTYLFMNYNVKIQNKMWSKSRTWMSSSPTSMVNTEWIGKYTVGIQFIIIAHFNFEFWRLYRVIVCTCRRWVWRECSCSYRRRWLIEHGWRLCWCLNSQCTSLPWSMSSERGSTSSACDFWVGRRGLGVGDQSASV